MNETGKKKWRTLSLSVLRSQPPTFFPSRASTPSPPKRTQPNPSQSNPTQPNPHPRTTPKVYASDLIVQTAFDWRHALHLGCVEAVTPHYVTQPGPLSVTLNWDLAAEAEAEAETGKGKSVAMSVPAVRGSPYATMEYGGGVRPVVSARQVGAGGVQ